MNRRTVLAGCGVLAGGFAGCLGADYEQCEGIVKFSALPEAAREEVSSALEDGPYETDGDLTLTEVLDVDEGRLVREYLYVSSYLRHYDIEIETDGDVTRLRVEETIPRGCSTGRTRASRSTSGSSTRSPIGATSATETPRSSSTRR